MIETLRIRIAGRPVLSFFVLTFVLSWSFMTPAMIWGLDSLAFIPFMVGVFMPFTAEAVVTRATGGSVRSWLRAILRRRVAARWFALALAFPVALAGVASALFAPAGESLDFGLVGERAAAFVPLFIYCLLLNGGPEELGWRGFALPRLQEGLSPVRATLVLGTAWGLWHLPLLFAEDNPDHNLATATLVAIMLWTLAGFVAYSFTYLHLPLEPDPQRAGLHGVARRL
jgi:uncharacterized protein